MPVQRRECRQGDDLVPGPGKSAEAACEIGEQQPRQLREDVCGRANGFLIERAQREPLAVAAPAVEDRFDRLQLRPGTLEFDLHLLAGFQDGERFGKQREPDGIAAMRPAWNRKPQVSRRKHVRWSRHEHMQLRRRR